MNQFCLTLAAIGLLFLAFSSTVSAQDVRFDTDGDFYVSLLPNVCHLNNEGDGLDCNFDNLSFYRDLDGETIVYMDVDKDDKIVWLTLERDENPETHGLVKKYCSLCGDRGIDGNYIEGYYLEATLGAGPLWKPFDNTTVPLSGGTVTVFKEATDENLRSLADEALKVIESEGVVFTYEGTDDEAAGILARIKKILENAAAGPTPVEVKGLKPTVLGKEKKRR